MSDDILRVFSYGGGVQSTAMLAMQALGRLAEPFDVMAFSNVGEDSEKPQTLKYFREIAQPYAKEHGIELVEIRKEGETLRERIMGDAKSVVIPAYITDAKGKVRRLHRNCTVDFKIVVVDNYIRLFGFERVEVGMGISLDEIGRVKSTEWYDREGSKAVGFWKRRVYPFIDLRMTREDCKKVIVEAGLPIPPSSRCHFCPFTQWNEWIDLERNEPDLFQDAIEIDRRLNDKESTVKGRASIHRSGISLENAVALQQPLLNLDDMDNCEDGYCMT